MHGINMGNDKYLYKILVENLKKRDYFAVDRKLVIQSILKM
jgi:hypothetical protein